MVTLFLAALLLGVGSLLVMACIRIEELLYEGIAEAKAEHAACIAHIASVTSSRVVSMALREAAIRWDSVEEKANLHRISREEYHPGGPSMPAIWLNYRADQIDPKPEPPDEDNPIYNLAGERLA